jgi:hypothetical protein
VINVSANVTGATSNNVHATYVLAADGTSGSLKLASVSGSTYTWQLGPIVWSQSHGLGGAITITVTASNAGGKATSSATVTLASCQDSTPPVITITSVSPTTVPEVDNTGQASCPTGQSQATITATITGASSINFFYTITSDGTKGTPAAETAGNTLALFLPSIQYAASHTDPKTNTGTIVVTITAANSQGISRTATATIKLLGCTPIIIG